MDINKEKARLSIIIGEPGKHWRFLNYMVSVGGFALQIGMVTKVLNQAIYVQMEEFFHHGTSIVLYG
jgi:hypothetical protein